jgi:hypothetical protein
MPNLLANKGITIDTTPKASKGNVVNNPRRELDNPCALPNIGNQRANSCQGRTQVYGDKKDS